MSEVQPLIDSEAHSAWDDDIEPGTPPLPPITSSCTSQELFKYAQETQKPHFCICGGPAAGCSHPQQAATPAATPS